MSDPKLSGDKINEERAFIKRYTEGIGGREVAYQGDFSTPLEDRPRKVAAIGVSLVFRSKSEDECNVYGPP